MTNTLTPRHRAGLLAVTVACLLVGAYGLALVASGFALLPGIVAANGVPTAVQVHVVAASAALLVLPWQLWPRPQGRPRHRALGRGYVAAALVGGLSGVVAAFGTSAGPVAGTGFALLGLAWLGATVTMLVNARARHTAAHRRWALRSAALAFAGVTLRLELPLLGLVLPFHIAYPVVAWVCWVPNLIIVQGYLRGQDRRSVVAGLPHVRAQRPADGGAPGGRRSTDATVGARPGAGAAAGRASRGLRGERAAGDRP